MKQFKYDFPAFLSQLFFRRLKGKQGKSLLALLLCGCMLFSLCSETVQAAGITAEPTKEDLIVKDSRVADPDTTDTYIDKLLSEKNGSRYAGRVWTDKSVFAYGADQSKGGVAGNKLELDNNTDGYDGKVGYDADFMHVYSALASSQVVNEFPATPIDLVIVFDMSGSMGQDTRFGIDSGSNTYVEHDDKNDKVEKKNKNEKGEDKSDTWNWKEESKDGFGIPMADRIKYSRIQITLDAINQTIENLMKQNLQNRVAVIGYGANATVLMPLAHWKTVKTNDEGNEKYLSVTGMETLYYPGDLTTDGNGWYWINNRDTCYTVEVNAYQNTTTTSEFNSQKDSTDKDDGWEKVTRTVSNNIWGGAETEKLESYGGNGKVKAFPGVETQDNEALAKSASTFQQQSKEIQDKQYKSGLNDNDKESKVEDKDKNKLNPLMKETKQLEADEYVGYYTNTQGGIYLGYKQLADTDATTYTEKLTNDKEATVARIPSAIIMSDGGANIILNPMGKADVDSQKLNPWTPEALKESKPYQKYEDWKKEFGKWEEEKKSYPGDNGDNDDLDKYYRLHNTKGQNGGTKGDDYQNIGDEWYNVWLPSIAYGGKDGYKGLPSIFNQGADVYQDGTLSTGPNWSNKGVLINEDNDITGTAGAALEVLMTASYMSQVVDKHYYAGWTKEKGGNRTSPESYEGRSLSTYTMNVDTEHVPLWGRQRLYPSLNPKEHHPDKISEWYKDTEKFGTDEEIKASVSSRLGNTVAGLYKRDQIFIGNSSSSSLSEAWGKLKSNQKADATATVNGTGAYFLLNLKPIPGDGIDYEAGGDSGEKVHVTQQDVIDNIAYNDEFYDVDSLDLSQTFDTILSEITGTVFIPIAGDNDAGAGNSITYQDPIGDYMEIKNGSITATPHHTGDFDNPIEDGKETAYDMAMLLFGEMHGLVRTGVYDYNFNSKHLNGGKFTMGWYKLKEGKDPADPENWEKVDDGSWESGDVYHFDSETLQSYVPIEGLDDSTEIGEQQQNTVYTVYRFACNTNDGSAIRRNPIYGDLPKNLSEEEQLKLPGVYKLNDIRVWVEEYGDYKDSDGAITPNPGAYDASLYCNVPAAAVPTQVAEISLGPEGVRSYKANIDDESRKDECTPLRLFYAVGLQEKLILRDEEGNQTGVDVSAISEEYIKSHTIEETGDIYFISNYYSETPYDGYITDDAESRTRGDPAVSFSPAVDNRYYLFQKPLPLYAHAYRVENNSLHPVDKPYNDEWGDNTQGGNGKTEWENGEDPAAWSGGYFMGVYGNEDEFQNKINESQDGYITDTYGNRYKVREDGIVFLKQDLLDDVTDGTGKSFSSDDWFFILLEFYLPNDDIPKDKDGNEIDDGVTQGGEAVQFVVTRKGSEFGSGLSSGKIKNGDMLCWTDVNGNFPENLHYNSYSETGDKTRGEPTYEKLTKTNEELKKYLKDCGIKDDRLDDEAAYWEEIQKSLGGLLKGEDGEPISEDDFEKNFLFAVAAKPGGLRTGDMAQNLGSKLDVEEHKKGVGNTTDTANNYYVPTVSDTSGIGSDAVIDNYLGNNGRLEIPNQELVVTKTLTPPEEFTLTETQKNKDFYYQVYLQGVTGERSAIKVQYNPYAKVWQRKMGAVDVLTDNSGLLLDNSSQRVLFDKGSGDETGAGETQGRPVVKGDDGSLYYADENGNPTENKCETPGNDLYYVYLPPNTAGVGGEESSRRVYEDPDFYGHGGKLSNAGRITYVPTDMEKPEDEEADPDALVTEKYENATEDRPAGTRAYYVTNAELVPVSEVEGKGETPDGAQTGSWSHSEGSDSGHVKLNQFTVLVRKPNGKAANFGDENTGAVGGKDIILSPYQIRTQYLTQKLVFGYAMNRDDGYGPTEQYAEVDENGNVTNLEGSKLTEEDIYNPEYKDKFPNIAEFTLKTGEGLLFTGLSKTPYNVTEYLSGKDLNDGYDLERVDHIINAENIEVEHPTNSAEGGGAAYSVDGTTEDFEHQVHYYNTFEPANISIVKELKAPEDYPYLNENDWNQEFDFTLELEFTDGIGETTDKKLSYTITSTDENQKDPGRSGSLLLPGFDGKVEDNDIEAEEGGDSDSKTVTWHFHLKGGQKFTLTGIPANTVYTYTVTEENSDDIHFDSEVTENSGGETQEEEPNVATGTVSAGGSEAVNVTFTNTKQKPKPVQVELNLYKTVESKDTEDTFTWDEGKSFTFYITPDPNNPEEDPLKDKKSVEVKVDKRGDTFAPTGEEDIFGEENKFTVPGIYTYTVSEKPSNLPGISSDGTVYTVKVEVTEDYEDGIYQGTLSAKIYINGKEVNDEDDNTEDGSLDFENTYNPKEISVPLNARKIFTGGELKGGEFSFELIGKSVSYDSEGTEPPSEPDESDPDVTDPDDPAGGGEETEKPPETGSPDEGEPPEEKDPEDGETPENNPSQPEDGSQDGKNPEEENEDLTGGETEGTEPGEEESGNKEPSEGETDPPAVEDSQGQPPEKEDKPETGTVPETGEGGDTSEGQTTPEGDLGSEADPEKEESSGSGDESRNTDIDAPEKQEPEGEQSAGGSETAAAAVIRAYRNIRTAMINSLSGINAVEEDEVNADNVVDGIDEEEGTAEGIPMPPGATEAEGKPSLTKKNDAYGNVSFGSVTFTEAGTYTYQIREISGDDEGIQYDNTVYEVTIVITEDEDGVLTLESIKYEPNILEGGIPTFKNEREFGSLQVKKTVTGSLGDKTRNWTFTVTFSPEDQAENWEETAELKFSDDNQDGHSVDWDKNVLSFTLKDGQFLDIMNLPAGTTYTVTEEEANQDGYTTTPTGDTGTIPPNDVANAEFINNLPDTTPGDLTVTKIVTGNAGERDREWHFKVQLSDTSVNGQYGDMFFENGVAEFTLKHGESKRAVGLPAGVTYTVTEKEANQDGYTTSSTGDTGTITESESAHAEFVNDRTETSGGLIVTKTVTGSAGDKNKEWHFRVELSDTSVNGFYGDMFFENGVAEFTLKHGETFSADGLPEGITYTVTEEEADQDGYTTSYTGETGTIPEEGNAHADFVNDKSLGGLTVTKTVTGESGDKTKEWHFRVELGDSSINGQFGDMFFVDGVAEFTLKDGESKNAEGLPPDITYTVTEEEAGKDGYTTSSTGESGTIPENGSAHAGFINDKTETEGGLTVTKTVTGSLGDKTKEWHFRVKLSDSSINGKFGDMVFVNGVAEFTLKDGETKHAEGLPDGITYTVTEKEADQDGYATLPSGESGIIPENGNAAAHFINDKRKGGLVVFKTVTGDAGDKTKEWHFRVQLSDPTINGQYGDMFFVDGVAEFTLKHGESFHAENLPVGVTHKVTEVEADTDGYDTSSSGETGTIPEEGSNKAAFVNDKTTGGLTVSKAVTGDDGEREREWHFKVELDDKTVNGQYGDMFFAGGVAEFTLKHGESFRAKGLPPGVGYTVSELEADQDDYVTLMRGETGTIPPEGSVSAYFINDRTTAHTNDTGASLTVSKTVTGNAGDRTKEWHFRIELGDKSISGQYGGLTFKNGAAEFTLKDGETVTVTNLPQGVTYTVTELEANQDGYTTSSTGESGTVPQSGGISAGFINHKDSTPPATPVTPPAVTTTTPPPERTATTVSTRTQGGLTVTKTVSGSAGDKDHVWHFSVMLSDKSISGQYGDMVFENGVAVFTLKHGGSFSATGLEEGVSYTVTEAEANQNGYVTSSTGDTGTVPGNGVTYARFENRRDSNPKTGMNTRIEPLLVLMGLGIAGLMTVPMVLKNRHKDSKPQSRNERFDKDRR